MNDAPKIKKSNCPEIFQDALLFYHFNFQKADSCFVAGNVCMNWRLELISPMDPLNFKDKKIFRPAGTVLRPGGKVFVCSTNGLLLWGKPKLYLNFFLAQRSQPTAMPY